MNIISALGNAERLFFDTAPIIYYIERNPTYFSIVKPIFDRMDDGFIQGVTSPITLAECLVGVYRLGITQSQNDFFDLIVYNDNMRFMQISYEQAQKAAELRARYNLTLSDALQIAVALFADCDAFLTNDITLKRVTEIKTLILDEFKVVK